MPNKLELPECDAIGAYARNAAAARRVGVGAQCACGEARPLALERHGKTIICGECEREKEGKAKEDLHHVAGRANDKTTMPAPLNDHRAELSAAQYNWPKQTLENSDGSPFLRAAACIRGFVDYIIYLVKKMLLWIPEMLEKADAFLRESLGSKWWMNTPIAQFVPTR